MRASARRSVSALRNVSHTQTSPLPYVLARPAFSQHPLLEQRRHRWFSSSDAAADPASPEPGSSKAAAEAAEQPQSAQSEAEAKLQEVEEQMDPLTSLREKHTEELRLMKNQLLTSMADFQNLQKRTERDVKAAREFAVQAFAKDLVSDLDVLALALSSVPESKRAEGGDLKTLYDGVSLTAVTLEKTLKRHGVVSFDPMGEVFDPNRHEATFQAPIPDKTPGTVFDVQKKGWTVGSRLLRPAQVGVVRAP